MDSIDRIALVDFDVYLHNDTNIIQANALIGTNADIEYEFILSSSLEDGHIILQPYSTKSVCSLPTLAKGEYVIRVNARQVGSYEEFERYCIQPIQI